MTLPKLRPGHIRYIKLGSGGWWWEQSHSEGILCFGYETVPHEVCERKEWDQVRNLLRPDRKSEGATTAGVTEVKSFYELGEDSLWITFADQHLWWAFADSKVQWVWDGNYDDPPRKRQTLDGWHNTDINGKSLLVTALSSRLTKVKNFQGTICKVPHEDYLLRRINAEEEPVVARANEALRAMTVVAVEMISGLHQDDFETLAALIFARSGWRLLTRVGGKLFDIDLELEEPITGELAFVQVKSKAAQATVNEYLDKFRRSGCHHFFFVCHQAQGKLTLPEERGLHLFEGERLADAAVKSGLYDWLIEKSG